MTLTTPRLGTVCYEQAETCYDRLNLSTKFEVPNFARYGIMKGVAKCTKWGGFGWFGVTKKQIKLIVNVTIR